MGCGGSKHDVASGNTVSRRLLHGRKSDAAKLAVKATASAVPADASGKPAPTPAAVADVKDITMNTDGREAAAASAGEGQLVSRDSPERYFSSRKEEEAVDAAVGGENFSPPCEPRGEEAGMKTSAGPALGGAGGITVSYAALVGMPEGKDDEKSGGGAAEGQVLHGHVPTEGNEKLSGIIAVDPKEPILVEETKLEAAIVEKKSIGICEIVSETS